MSGELLQDTAVLQNDAERSAVIDMECVTETICPTKLAAMQDGVAYGEVIHITYHSTACGCERGANILLPPNYDKNKKYPVLYFLHGIFGDENSMLGDENNHIKEIVGNLAAEGTIGEVLLVFPNMYATGNPDLKPGFTLEQTAPYDYFVNDLAADLIPYVEANFSVLTDRKNRGLIGFSMGGRETLFIGTTRSDLFDCFCAVAPAPGVTPGKDWAMEHPGQMQEKEFVIRQKDYMPKFVMVCAGTKDSVVGKFPESYHRILTANGVKHIWFEVPEADHDSNAIRSGLYNYLIRWFA